MRQIFIDVETTQILEETSLIWSISGIVLYDGKIQDNFDIQFNPFTDRGFHVDPSNISDWNIERGITADFLQIFDKEQRGAFFEFQSILMKHADISDKFYMYGFNVAYDFEHVSRWFERNNRKMIEHFHPYHVDVRSILIEKHKHQLDIFPKLNLETFALGYDIPLDAHNSFSDIKATLALYIKSLKS